MGFVGGSSVYKPSGTFVPRWEDVKNHLELDLRELSAQKRKRKEAPTTESDSLSHCVRVKTPNSKIMYKL